MKNTTYIKGKMEVRAVRWMINGDIPEDNSQLITGNDGKEFLTEGEVVRRYRNSRINGSNVCSKCYKRMDHHGWIEDRFFFYPGGGAQTRKNMTVCPGDWVLTDKKERILVVENDIFKKEWKRMTSRTPEDQSPLIVAKIPTRKEDAPQVFDPIDSPDAKLPDCLSKKHEKFTEKIEKESPLITCPLCTQKIDYETIKGMLFQMARLLD